MPERTNKRKRTAVEEPKDLPLPLSDNEESVPKASSEPTEDTIEPTSKKAKKSKKKSGKSKKPTSGKDKASHNDISEAKSKSLIDQKAGEQANHLNDMQEDADVQDASSKSKRFIVFIGNLPFSATKESVEAHFKSVKPSSVRLITPKDDPSKCKGFAFLEFEGFDRMKTCLKQFHHSSFDDGSSLPRKINVELTAGGGGSKQFRKDKIKVKNQKLNEERKRRREAEDASAKEKRKSKSDAATQDGIHPSRRAQVVK